ncbi:pyrimidine dimer DNA glycosylase/endonuclease V [Terrabacter ginsenosidimutans]|uniref:pyrimidine dimer DNA glycosylase/endonuclease V n=1 Tax=Terrabacter ginsenosidimutans TaxID=490575 RepID=UPI0031ED6484
MQTFVPYADFARTAAVLDTRRLGKQRVEVIQIVRALTVPGGELVVDDALPAWLFDDAVQSSRRRTRCEGAGGEPPSPQRRRQEGLAGSPPGRPARLSPISGRRRPSSRRDARATRARRHG